MPRPLSPSNVARVGGGYSLPEEVHSRRFQAFLVARYAGAAIIIQAGARRWLARTLVRRMRAAAAAPPPPMPSLMLQIPGVAASGASTQSRGAYAHAALRIQCAARRLLARRRVAALRAVVAEAVAAAAAAAAAAAPLERADSPVDVSARCLSSPAASPPASPAARSSAGDEAEASSASEDYAGAESPGAPSRSDSASSVASSPWEAAPASPDDSVRRDSVGYDAAVRGRFSDADVLLAPRRASTGSLGSAAGSPAAPRDSEPVSEARASEGGAERRASVASAGGGWEAAPRCSSSSPAAAEPRAVARISAGAETRHTEPEPEWQLAEHKPATHCASPPPPKEEADPAAGDDDTAAEAAPAPEAVASRVSESGGRSPRESVYEDADAVAAAYARAAALAEAEAAAALAARAAADVAAAVEAAAGEAASEAASEAFASRARARAEAAAAREALRRVRAPGPPSGVEAAALRRWVRFALECRSGYAPPARTGAFAAHASRPLRVRLFGIAQAPLPTHLARAAARGAPLSARVRVALYDASRAAFVGAAAYTPLAPATLDRSAVDGGPGPACSARFDAAAVLYLHSRAADARARLVLELLLSAPGCDEACVGHAAPPLLLPASPGPKAMCGGDAAEAGLRPGPAAALAAGGRHRRSPPLGSARFVYAVEAAPKLAPVAILLPPEAPVSEADAVPGVRGEGGADGGFELTDLDTLDEAGFGADDSGHAAEDAAVAAIAKRPRTPLEAPALAPRRTLALRDVAVEVPAAALAALRAGHAPGDPLRLALRVAAHSGRSFVGTPAAVALRDGDASGGEDGSATFVAIQSRDPASSALQLACPADGRCALVWELLHLPAGAADDDAGAAACAAWGAALVFGAKHGDDGVSSASDDDDTDHAAHDALLPGSYAAPMRGGPGPWLRDGALLTWPESASSPSSPVLRFRVDDAVAEARRRARASAAAREAEDGPEASEEPRFASRAPRSSVPQLRQSLVLAHERQRAAVAALHTEQLRAIRASITGVIDPHGTLKAVADKQAQEMEALSEQLRQRLARLRDIHGPDAAADAAIEAAREAAVPVVPDQPSAGRVAAELSEQMRRVMAVVSDHERDAEAPVMAPAQPQRARSTVRDRALARAAAAAQQEGFYRTPSTGSIAETAEPAVVAEYAPPEAPPPPPEEPEARVEHAFPELPPQPRPVPPRLDRSLSPQRGGASGRIKADPELGALARREGDVSPVRGGGGSEDEAEGPLADVAAARERRRREIALAALRDALPEMAERNAAVAGNAVVRRTFSVALAPERPVFAKIVHVNAADATRTFHLRSTHPALVTLQPEVVTLVAGGEVAVALQLAPLEQWGPAARSGLEDVLIFVNDGDDVNAGIFKCKVTGVAA